MGRRKTNGGSKGETGSIDFDGRIGEKMEGGT
jgi:hypothetical protein